MNEHNLYRSNISPIPEGLPQPLWSVMIPTYNCAEYLRETLGSVLAQDLGPDLMQIEVVDDCSTKDDPKAVVEELGKGRVSFYRHPQNVGYIQNFNTCLQRSQGQLIHLLHGDDCVRDGFYRKLQQAFDEQPEIGAAFCRIIKMDEHGHWKMIYPLEQPDSGIYVDGLHHIVSRHPIETPSIVVRRAVYEHLDGFDKRFTCCAEDWEMWVRIAAHYPVWYEVEPLAIYRSHSASLTGRFIRTGHNIRDTYMAREIIKSYLPETAMNALSRSKELWGLWGLHCARKLLARQQWTGAIIQIREVLRSYCSFKIVISIIRLAVELGQQWIKGNIQKLTKAY
ncbi:glycosyltransferase [Funiculus sociatus GB2-A5]|uniref:Glycosyltransferase n=1 Tax=Funiculus sociatus GB2-A5 TaxID=2933946 RepID=A0ABV0JVQ8_9CYAN|nr:MULTISPECIES: glycosyltransferase [unclassified Trichocoleus]MBD1907413.1 glycosyltransferase [Trichocoleus sp. FACHB-832]MBD2063190.1 glycosyltransferase [Trichocoleus sp. FACHB-6]